MFRNSHNIRKLKFLSADSAEDAEPDSSVTSLAFPLDGVVAQEPAGTCNCAYIYLKNRIIILLHVPTRRVPSPVRDPSSADAVQAVLLGLSSGESVLGH